jgi:hypothetical protein
LLIVSCPIKIESVYANLLGIKKIELPVIAYMDNLAWLKIHCCAHPKVKIGGLQLLVVGGGRENVSKMRLYVL